MLYSVAHHVLCNWPAVAPLPLHRELPDALVHARNTVSRRRVRGKMLPETLVKQRVVIGAAFGRRQAKHRPQGRNGTAHSLLCRICGIFAGDKVQPQTEVRHRLHIQRPAGNRQKVKHL